MRPWCVRRRCRLLLVLGLSIRRRMCGRNHRNTKSGRGYEGGGGEHRKRSQLYPREPRQVSRRTPAAQSFPLNYRLQGQNPHAVPPPFRGSCAHCCALPPGSVTQGVDGVFARGGGEGEQHATALASLSGLDHSASTGYGNGLRAVCFWILDTTPAALPVKRTCSVAWGRRAVESGFPIRLLASSILLCSTFR